jgi:hypothetical protein
MPGAYVRTRYSSPPAGDLSWVEGFGGRTDIRPATIDLARVAERRS